jgi:hypothetical protein
MAHGWLTNLAQNSVGADDEQRIVPSLWQKRFDEAENGSGRQRGRA